VKVYLDIRTMRLKLNWSLRDLEYYSGVSRSSLNNYENGFSEPTLTNYVKIAKAFQVSVENIENKLLKIE